MWLDEDREWALAWQDHQRDLCGGCGHSLTVTTAPSSQFGYAGEVVRCHACAAQQRTLRAFTDGDGDTAGALVAMTRTPDPDP